MSLPRGLGMTAVITVRDGQLPVGADETVAEAGGLALLAGTGTREAAGTLRAARRVWLVESASVAPGRLAAALAPALAHVDGVLLPASPDGRDLAPRLAVELGRPLLAGAVRCVPGEAELSRLDGRLSVRVAPGGPVVLTLLPGVRGAPEPQGPPEITELPLNTPDIRRDAETLEVLRPEPGTMDLAEAPRILGGGAGLVPAGVDGLSTMRLLADVAAALGASAGATRVATDAGWTGHDRQIGTTGVSVDPDLYIAFGISGASQHIGGLGQPRHVVSVNTDPSCPMTDMADLGIVADAPAVLGELARRLGVDRAAEAGAAAKGENHG
ncbi:mycofactocin-associated electron transfer flavoprotein alpha subunit [Streptomyces decoyicus]|uniref:mycofactocin-associated electron transfer flavoprotein alpha subunit n=1 Tax=Streptomyces decoyicus TaxID=249567 RepID=UPI0033A6662A